MKTSSAVGKILAFFLAIFGSSSCANTATPAQGSPQELLAAVTKSNVRDFWTNDFGREKRSGGYSVIGPTERAETFLKSVREQLPTGYVAFVGTTNNLDDPKIKGVEIVLAPGQDQFDIIRLAATDAVNYDKTTDQIIEELRQWDSQFGIDIWQAETASRPRHTSVSLACAAAANRPGLTQALAPKNEISAPHNCFTCRLLRIEPNTSKNCACPPRPW